MNNVTTAEQATTNHTFELNAVIIGMLARAYSCAAHSTTPQRAWGSKISNKAIHWNGDGYSATVRNLNGKPGLVLTKTFNQLDGGTKQEVYWIPLDAFTSMKVNLPAVRL